MATVKKQTNSNKDINVLVLFVGTLCALLFIYSVLVVAQNLVNTDMLDSPNSYAALPGILLGIYGYFKATTSKQRQIAISIIVAILVSGTIWLFGLTSVGDIVPRDHKSCGCLPPPNPEV